MNDDLAGLPTEVVLQITAFRAAVSIWLPGHSEIAVDKAFATYLANSALAGGVTAAHSEWSIRALARTEPRWRWLKTKS
jgi:hypothetical protein